RPSAISHQQAVLVEGHGWLTADGRWLHLSIFSTRRSWRPPSNEVSSHLCRMLIPCSSLTNCAGSTRTFESPCSRDSSATCSFHASAARTWGKRLAVYDIPNPVPQVRIPRDTFPVLTASATGLP